MLVDGGEGKQEGAIENLAKIRYAVEDGNKVAKACDEADDELSEDGSGDIFARSGKRSVSTGASLSHLEVSLGNLFCKVGHYIWGTNGVGPIQHAE